MDNAKVYERRNVPTRALLLGRMIDARDSFSEKNRLRTWLIIVL